MKSIIVFGATESAKEIYTEIAKDYKIIYEGLISGDPKLRTYRALFERIYGRYISEAKREEAKRVE